MIVCTSYAPGSASAFGYAPGVLLFLAAVARPVFLSTSSRRCRCSIRAVRPAPCAACRRIAAAARDAAKQDPDQAPDAMAEPAEAGLLIERVARWTA